MPFFKKNSIQILHLIFSERKLRTTKFLFNRLCQANANLGKCFALPIAVALVFKIISCTLNLFLFVYYSTAQNDVDLKVWAFQFISDTLFTIILFAAADLPAEQVIFFYQQYDFACVLKINHAMSSLGRASP